MEEQTKTNQNKTRRSCIIKCDGGKLNKNKNKKKERKKESESIDKRE